jgi:phenylacetate-CoA ligase
MNRQHRYGPAYYRNSLEVLETSLGQLDAYRAWRPFDPGAGYHIDQRYAALPVLTKRDIREHFPQGFVPAGRDIESALGNGEIQVVSTSGSSDAVSVTNIWHQPWWDASEKASWKLNSHAVRLATGNHPEAILANARNVGIISDEADLPFEKRRLSRFLFLNEKTNPAAWTPQLMDRMIDELTVFKPDILEANPSLLAKLSRYASLKRKPVFQPGLIVFTYEYPSGLHYRQIRRVFTAPTASSYGTTETGYVFMECEAGKFHQNSDFCRVDFQPLKPEHGGPQIGRILVTTFNNPWYYILRFDVGDLVRLDTGPKCACGRDAGLIATAVEGRFSNATLTCDGRLVTLRQLDDIMSGLEGLDEYRLEQTAPGVFILYLVARPRVRGRLSQSATLRLGRLYGREADITVVPQEALAPEDSGKYCLAKTLFPMEINDYLAGGDASG